MLSTPLHSICRGESFRTEYAQLGELRSILPSAVHIMALTATATEQQRKAITSSLGMINEIHVTAPPDKSNIKYSVAPFETLNLTFGPIAKQLLQLGPSTPRTVIFCKKLDDCPMLYRFFRKQLVANFTNPPGCEDKCGNRVVDMFHSCTEPCIKDSILKLFAMVNSNLWLLIATVAFGMGVDVPNIRTIIHFGACGDIESYVQAVGRAGRDGKHSNAIIFVRKSKKHIDTQIKTYIENTTICRRTILFRGFGFSSPPVTKCMCCDVCAHVCKCINCECDSGCISFAYVRK